MEDLRNYRSATIQFLGYLKQSSNRLFGVQSAMQRCDWHVRTVERAFGRGGMEPEPNVRRGQHLHAGFYSNDERCVRHYSKPRSQREDYLPLRLSPLDGHFLLGKRRNRGPE